MQGETSGGVQMDLGYCGYYFVADGAPAVGCWEGQEGEEEGEEQHAGGWGGR